MNSEKGFSKKEWEFGEGMYPLQKEIERREQHTFPVVISMATVLLRMNHQFTMRDFAYSK